jgi:hypothetical protein
VCGKCKWHLGSCNAKNTQPKRIQELEEALRQALNQWQMYAEQDPDFDSTIDPTPEGIEYRKCLNVLEGR